MTFQAAIKNVIGDAKQIAAKTKNMEEMTGFFKNKFTGKPESVKNVLSVVSVSVPAMLMTSRTRKNFNAALELGNPTKSKTSSVEEEKRF